MGKNDNRIQRHAYGDAMETLDQNRDPITDTPGAHPLGTGVGAASGGVAGASVGALGGPIGVAAGLVVGAVAGGLAGKGVAELVDPTAEDAYWRDEYVNRAYTNENEPYDIYQSAYRTGYEGYGRYSDRTYEEAEADLQRDYEATRSGSDLTWGQAQQATRDAWNRAKDSVTTDDTHRDMR